MMEQLGLRLGMWYWKDETKTLEFRRLTDKRFALRDDKSPRGLEKRSQQGNVTLHDAKFVALLLLQDTEMPRICSFTTFMRNKNLDNFLMALLYYLYYYLEKISQEKKPKSYMIGLVEKKEMEMIISKLEAAQKYLAQKYCVLVLGLGMPDKHHMSCGKGKISDTQKDWKFFESFYTFCTYVAWIVFRRQHFTEIEEEIGRLFRSNMFNIPRRKREDEESGGEKKRMTFVQFRRMMAKRPAIKKAIHMRSPVMSTLLPSLREKAQNVSEKKYRQIGTKFPAQMQEPRETLDSLHMPMRILYQLSQQGKSKNTGVGSLSLLQGIFLTQELNWGLLHWRRILYQLNYQGSPMLVSLCSTSFKLGFSSTWMENFQMYKLGLEKAEEPEIKLPTFVGS